MGNQASSQCIALEDFINEHREPFLTEIKKIPKEKQQSVDKNLRENRHDCANIVIITRGNEQKHIIWQKIGFSVLLLFETEFPYQLYNFMKLSNFEGYDFLIITMDSISAEHIIFFLNKSKVFLGRTELIERIIMCKTKSTNEFDFFMQNGETQINEINIMNAPPISIVDPTETQIVTQSDSLFTSSSYAAFQTYKRTISQTTFDLTDVNQSEVSDLQVSTTGASSFFRPISEPLSVDMSSNSFATNDSMSIEELDKQRIMKRYVEDSPLKPVPGPSKSPPRAQRKRAKMSPNKYIIEKRPQTTRRTPIEEKPMKRKPADAKRNEEKENVKPTEKRPQTARRTPREEKPRQTMRRKPVETKRNEVGENSSVVERIPQTAIRKAVVDESSSISELPKSSAKVSREQTANKRASPRRTAGQKTTESKKPSHPAPVEPQPTFVSDSVTSAAEDSSRPHFSMVKRTVPQKRTFLINFSSDSSEESS